MAGKNRYTMLLAPGEEPLPVEVRPGAGIREIQQEFRNALEKRKQEKLKEQRDMLLDRKRVLKEENKAPMPGRSEKPFKPQTREEAARYSNPQSFDAPQEDIISDVRDWSRQALTDLGLPENTAWRLGEDVGTVAEFTPIGTVASLQAAKRAHDEGRRGGAIGNVLMAIPDMLAPAAKGISMAAGIGGPIIRKGAGKVDDAVESVLEAVAAQAPTKIPRQPALKHVWNGVTNYTDALKVAEGGGHLRVGSDGILEGSPGLTMETLGPWRENVQQQIANSRRQGLGWYQEGRDAISEVSDSPAKESLLARGGAAYSPNNAPSDETNMFLRHHNQRMITGGPGRGGMQQHANEVERAYGPLDQRGYTQLFPEDIRLGEKTGPYAEAKDPTVPMPWRAANDIWHGRLYDYASPITGLKPFKGSFQPAQHAFMTGENTLGTKMAIDAGYLPEGATVPNFQEVGWVEKRKQSYLEEQNARYVAGKRPAPPTEEEALEYAKEGIPEAIERHTASISREYAPGGGLGEFPMVGSHNPELNEQFAARLEGATANPKSSVLSALELYQRPTLPVQGYWNDPVAGLQLNPAFVDRPLVGLKSEMAPTLPRKNKPSEMKLGGVAMDPYSKQGLEAAGILSGIENTQYGVGTNIFVPGNTSHMPSQLNGIYFPAETRAEAIERATAAGLDVVDNADGGIVVTKFLDANGDPVPMMEQSQIIKGFGSDLAGNKPGRFDSDFVSSGLSDEQGTGKATERMLEKTGAIPGFEQRLENSTYPAEVGRRNEEKQALAHELATSLRPDVQKLRDLLAQGGPAAVRRWTDINGFKGLPAWTAILLGGGAAVSTLSGQPSEEALPVI